MCPRIHGRPFGESGIAARATTVELQLQLLSAWCWCALLRWEVPSASVENNRSPGTVPLHSGRCDPLLPFGALLAPHTFILPSGRGVEELERRRRGTRRPSWQGIGTQGSTRGRRTPPHQTLRRFRQMQSAISFAGKPAHAQPPSCCQGGAVARFPVSTLASHAARQGLCRPNTGAGELSRVSDTAASRPPSQTYPNARSGLAWPHITSTTTTTRPQEGWLAAQRQPGRGRGVRQVNLGLWGRGMPSGAPVFSW